MMSASREACSTLSTRKPCFSASSQDFEPGIEPDDDIAAAVLQVQRMGVALRAKTDNGDLAPAEQ